MRHHCAGEYRRTANPRSRLLIAVLALGAVASCVAPASQLGTISPADLKAEQLKQEQLVIRSDLRDQQRLEDVGYPLLKAALPMCGPGATDTRAGSATRTFIPSRSNISSLPVRWASPTPSPSSASRAAPPPIEPASKWAIASSESAKPRSILVETPSNTPPMHSSARA